MPGQPGGYCCEAGCAGHSCRAAQAPGKISPGW